MFESVHNSAFASAITFSGTRTNSYFTLGLTILHVSVHKNFAVEYIYVTHKSVHKNLCASYRDILTSNLCVRRARAELSVQCPGLFSLADKDYPKGVPSWPRGPVWRLLQQKRHRARNEKLGLRVHLCMAPEAGICPSYARHLPPMPATPF